MKKVLLFLFLLCIKLPSFGQGIPFTKVTLNDSTALVASMESLAKAYLDHSKKGDLEIESSDRYIIEILAGEYEASIKSIEALRENSELNLGHPRSIQYEVFSKAKSKQLVSGLGFSESYRSIFSTYLMNCEDEKHIQPTYYLLPTML